MPEPNIYDALRSLSISFLCLLLFYGFGYFFLSLISFLVLVMFLHKLINIPRKIKTADNFHVVIVGAGVSGICMGKKLNDIGVKYTILEKSPRLGGTWWENIYPGERSTRCVPTLCVIL